MTVTAAHERSAPLDATGGTGSSIRSVGGVLPADLLAAVVGGQDLPGLSSDDYHLELGVTPREAANRAWSVLTGAWAGYRHALDARRDGDPAVGLTREKWLGVILRELGFGRVPPTPAGGIVADRQSWPVSHLADGEIPVHLLGWRTDLDHLTPGLAGAADRAPQAMVQELLNRSDRFLWAIVASGRTLRLLRDSSTLVGPSYVEVDLEAMFDGEAFSDFVLLYLLCHQSRFEALDPGVGQASCWLERWRSHAVETGTRALGALRVGVHDALEVLGTGLLGHPANTELRAALDERRLDLADYQRALLRIVYRLLFVFVAEDRNLLLAPGTTDLAAARYRRWYSTRRLRRIATRRRGDHHHDLWEALRLVLDGLGAEDGCAALGLPGLGGIFETGPVDVGTGAQLANRDLLSVIRHLSIIRPAGGGPRRIVNYRNLGAEELGGIYESLLEYIPRYDAVTRTFTLQSLAGNDRKKTGAYYTPTSLTESLLDTALDPLLDRATAAPDPEAALLALTVCDPACGSGHFLVAAARRIAGRLAIIRADGGEPTLDDVHTAMHDVVARCIYGVDLNPLAAELAKVSLWLEGLQAGAPLSLLDGHIKVGNALLGTTPALLADGVPDAAFTPIEGDDRKLTAVLKKRNRAEQAGQHDLFTAAGVPVSTTALRAEVDAIETLPARSLADVHIATKRLRDLDMSPGLRHARLVADAWCAAFVLPKSADQPALTHGDLLRLQERSIALNRAETDPLVAAVERAAETYRFFHWHLEFPQIFIASTTGDAANPAPGWAGGFDCVIGNPPWERVKLQEQEWFASRLPAIVDAPNSAARKRLIAQLAGIRPELHNEFLAARRQAEGESHLIRNSGRYPLCGRGDINTYAIFAEADRALLGGNGRLGVILPSGIATDATTQHFFKSLVVSKALVSLFAFREIRHHFPGTDDRNSFCLFTVIGAAEQVAEIIFAFRLEESSDLRRDGVRFTLTPEEITLLNPNTGTCPVFRTRRDAEITLGIYHRHPILIRKGDPNGNPWGVSFMRMIDMSNDSGLFRTRHELEADGWTLEGNTFSRQSQTMLPLYEAKMIHHYDHRWATYTDGGKVRDVTRNEHADPSYTVLPRYWVDRREVRSRLAERWMNDWLIGFRDICRSTDERTLICGMIPVAGVGHKFPLMIVNATPTVFSAVLSSLAVDYVSRQKVGGTSMGYFIVEQLPMFLPSLLTGAAGWAKGQTLRTWIENRADELIYTAYDMAPAALALDDDGDPFVWDPERRAVMRAELDAAFFHLYGIVREDVDYILSTFKVLNNNDVKEHGEERTRRLVLDAYDRMAVAIDGGPVFKSTLDPAPGEGRRHERVGERRG